MNVRSYLGRLIDAALGIERRTPAAQPVHRFRFTDPAPAPDPVIVAGSYAVEMEMGLHALCGIFGAHGWQLHRPGRGPQPSAVDLADVLSDMVLVVDRDDHDDAFYQYARFVAVRSSDFPEDVDLYLHVGTATRQGDDDPDAPGDEIYPFGETE